MPLTPAIRPVNNISRTAESPIQGAANGGRYRREIGHDGSVGFDSREKS